VALGIDSTTEFVLFVLSEVCQTHKRGRRTTHKRYIDTAPLILILFKKVVRSQLLIPITRNECLENSLTGEPKSLEPLYGSLFLFRDADHSCLAWILTVFIINAKDLIEQLWILLNRLSDLRVTLDQLL